MYTDKVIDFCLDNRLMNEKLFKNSLIEILEGTEKYDHEENGMKDCCTCDFPPLMERLQNLVDKHRGQNDRLSHLTEGIEKEYTKRELALLVVNSMQGYFKI